MKWFSIVIKALFATGLLAVVATVFAEESLTAVSYGGSYGKAQKEAIFKPFEEETGIKVNIEDYNGGLAQIRAQVESGNVHWDVVDIEPQDDLIGCDEGLLEYLDQLELPDGSDGTSAEEDYLEGANSDCGLGTIVWATVIAYSSSVFEENPPTSINDFFDLEKFPGKRGMRRVVEVNLEFALMADGVPVDEIYESLATEEGVDRAFAKLDTIKDSIVWWEAGAQPPQLLADEEVTLTTAYNGRIFNAQVMEEQPFEIIWNGHMRDYARMVIPAGSPNVENAKKLLQFAARSTSLAGVSNRIAYAPLRKSSLDFVDKHVEAGIDMLPHMPTAPNNSKNFIVSNTEFWLEYKDTLKERFTSWLSR